MKKKFLIEAKWKDGYLWAFDSPGWFVWERYKTRKDRNKAFKALSHSKGLMMDLREVDIV